jgi:hypothetical protein
VEKDNKKGENRKGTIIYMIYHLMLKTELEDFHLLDVEQHIPLGSYCKYRTIYVIRKAKKIAAIIWKEKKV